MGMLSGFTSFVSDCESLSSLRAVYSFKLLVPYLSVSRVCVSPSSHRLQLCFLTFFAGSCLFLFLSDSKGRSIRVLGLSRALFLCLLMYQCPRSLSLSVYVAVCQVSMFLLISVLFQCEAMLWFVREISNIVLSNFVYLSVWVVFLIVSVCFSACVSCQPLSLFLCLFLCLCLYFCVCFSACVSVSMFVSVPVLAVSLCLCFYVCFCACVSCQPLSLFLCLFLCLC